MILKVGNELQQLQTKSQNEPLNQQERGSG